MLVKYIFALVSLAFIQVASANAGENVVDATKACYAGFVKNIPPTFCYKKGADFGVIPTGCSAGFFRSVALCYKHCDSGYYFVLGVCWAHCRSGYADHGLTCYKHLFDWYFKHSYVDQSYTNFDPRVPCDPGMYKAGALCYRDCAQRGLLNCGIGACSLTHESCVQTIVSMGIDFLTSLAKSIETVISIATAGTTTAITTSAKAAISGGFKAAGKAALKTAVNAAKTAIQRMTVEKFITHVTEYAIKNVGKAIAAGTIATVCENVGKSMLGKLNSASDVVLDFQNFDITGISNAVSTCKTINNQNDEIMCAKSVLQAVDFVDPTGIVGMAAAFMQPICEGI